MPLVPPVAFDRDGPTNTWRRGDVLARGLRRFHGGHGRPTSPPLLLPLPRFRSTRPGHISPDVPHPPPLLRSCFMRDSRQVGNKVRPPAPPETLHRLLTACTLAATPCPFHQMPHASPRAEVRGRVEEALRGSGLNREKLACNNNSHGARTRLPVRHRLAYRCCWGWGGTTNTADHPRVAIGGEVPPPARRGQNSGRALAPLLARGVIP